MSEPEVEIEEHEPGFHTVEDLHRTVSLEKFNYKFQTENSTFVPVFPDAFKQTGYSTGAGGGASGAAATGADAARSRLHGTEGTVEGIAQVSTQRPSNGSFEGYHETSVKGFAQDASEGSAQGPAGGAGSVQITAHVHSNTTEPNSAHLNGNVIQGGGAQSALNSHRPSTTGEDRRPSTTGQSSAVQPASVPACPADGSDQYWTAPGLPPPLDRLWAQPVTRPRVRRSS